MSNPVKIVVGVDGAAESKSALKSINDAVLSLEKQAAAAVASGSKERIDATLKEVAQRSAQYQKLANVIKGINGGGGSGGSSPLDALMGGKGLGGMLAAAGVAGLAIKGFEGALSMATASLRQFGSYVINDVIKPHMALDTRGVQMANNSGGAITAGLMTHTARSIALQNNMDPMALVGAAGQFQDLTGDSKMGFQIMDTLATISKGRGMDMGALTGMAGALYKPGQSKDDLQAQILGLVKQGELGSVKADQIAALGGRFTAPMQHLAGTNYTKTMEMGALLQTAKPQIGSADATMSAVDALMREAFRPAAMALSKRSIVKDASGINKIGDIGTFIGDTLKKTGGGNITKLTAAGYTGESAKVLQAYQGNYEAGFKKAKAGGATDAKAAEAGGKAVEDFIHSLMTATTTLESEAAARDAVMQTDGQKIQHTMGAIGDAMADKLMPTVGTLANAFEGHTDQIVKAAETLAGVLLVVADGGLLLLEAFDAINKTFGPSKVNGDVLKTVVNKGDKTILPHMDEAGYWSGQSGSMLKYIKSDSTDPNPANRGRKTMVNGQAVYQGMGADTDDKGLFPAPFGGVAPAGEPAKKKEGAPAYLDQSFNTAKTHDPGADAARIQHAALANAARDAAEALKMVKAMADGLNRNNALGTGGGHRRS